MSKLFSVIKYFRYNRTRLGTVRFMFPAMLSFALVLGASVITANDASYVRLQTNHSTIEAGNRFTVDVYAYAHTPVNAIDITLRFDANAVEVLEVDRGQSVLTIWTQDPVIEKGKVILQGGTFKKGFLKEHKIASIDFKAKRTGASTFKATDILLLAGDGAGSPVPLAKSDKASVSLYIYDDNSSPESIKVNVAVNIVTDIDGDGKVTLKDISAFMAAWANKSKIHDFNGDGRMTFKDFSIILANFFF